jgi:uncharacterized integral membrane protein
MSAAAIAVRVGAAAVSDKRVRTAFAVIVASMLMPILLIVIVIIGVANGAANHNNAALNLTFNGGVIPNSMPQEYRVYISEMQDCWLFPLYSC